MSFIIAVCLSCRGGQLAGGKFLAFQHRLVGVASVFFSCLCPWMKVMGVLMVQACNSADWSLLKVQAGLLCCVVGLVFSVNFMPANPSLHTGSLGYMPSQAQPMQHDSEVGMVGCVLKLALHCFMHPA